MERWERELERLKEVDAPASTRGRMDAGPTGDGMPPSSGRGQRIAAGVVACLVFLLGAALVAAAFRGDPATGPSIAPSQETAVLTLAAEPNDAVASLTYRGATADPVVDSYCWNQDNGAQRCADVAMAEPFVPEDYLAVPEGTAFALVNDDGADPLTLVLAQGNDPYAAGDPTTLDELSRLSRGRYVLTVTANWEGRGENVTFHLPVQIAVGPPSPIPTASVSPVPTVSPEPTADRDREIERSLNGTSWALGQIDDVMLDIEEPPTAIFSTERLVGFNGCNGYGAEDWSVSDGRLVTGEIAQTLILCPGGLEGRFMAILGGEPIIAVDGSKLTLTTDTGSMVFDRIDVDHGDIVGSFLDCWIDDRKELRPPAGVDQPGPPAYFTVNLPWIEPSDELVRIAGSVELDQASRWVVIRDGLVVAEVDYPDLTGVACRSSGA